MNDTVDGTVPSDSRDNVQTRTDLVVGTIPDLYAPDQDLNNTLALAIQMICDSQGSQRDIALKIMQDCLQLKDGSQ
eukprot:CAMPEP_0172195226 /NCGR_PEP_ID=MMETSP1050-20130122/26075_1 /TAXON_ID=233186 /ORGANISM="Cryptomonas curvata, Strain CCAP979/52" /LENGTH=75 /DNA_ID=CAMNT_0012871235 /DNA_START=63 /DNA_END=287 /DNA_ORIENTATION=+